MVICKLTLDALFFSLIVPPAKFADIEKAWTQSMGYFQRSLDGFHKVKDNRNESGVLLNIIRLHKIAAKAHMSDLGSERMEFGPQERHHFNEVSLRLKNTWSFEKHSCHFLSNTAH